MLVGIAIGQRTPGRTAAEGREFEERIGQRYVDHLAGARWGYYGVYQVEGLVPGTFGEVVTAEGDDLADALRRDEENDRELPDDVASIYAECRNLFWQRGRIGFLWRNVAEPPPRGVPLRVSFGDGTFSIEPVDATGFADVDVVPEDEARIPEAIPPGATLVFHPFTVAPPPSSG